MAVAMLEFTNQTVVELTHSFGTVPTSASIYDVGGNKLATSSVTHTTTTTTFTLSGGAATGRCQAATRLIGAVVELIDVSGAPGLPAVDGSNLTGMSGGVFGTEYHSAESLTQSTTTTQDPSWTEKLKLTTGTLPTGTYIVYWSRGVRVDGNSGAKAVDCQLEMDDTTQIGQGASQIKDDQTNNYATQGGVVEVTFGSAATHTFDIDFRVGTGKAGTVQIVDARIKLWRVS